MKIELEGKTYNLEVDDIRNRQAEAIYTYTGGLTVKTWLDSLTEKPFEPAWIKSWDALYWLMLLQNDPPHPGSPADVDYPLFQFVEQYMDRIKEQQDAAKKAEPDPTQSPAASEQSPESPTPESLRSSGPAGEATPHG